MKPRDCQLPGLPRFFAWSVLGGTVHRPPEVPAVTSCSVFYQFIETSSLLINNKILIFNLSRC